MLPQVFPHFKSLAINISALSQYFSDFLDINAVQQCKLYLQLLSQGVHVFPWRVFVPEDDNQESITLLKIYCLYSTLLHFSSIIYHLVKTHMHHNLHKIQS